MGRKRFDHHLSRRKKNVPEGRKAEIQRLRGVEDSFHKEKRAKITFFRMNRRKRRWEKRRNKTRVPLPTGIRGFSGRRVKGGLYRGERAQGKVARSGKTFEIGDSRHQGGGPRQERGVPSGELGIATPKLGVHARKRKGILDWGRFWKEKHARD